MRRISMLALAAMVMAGALMVSASAEARTSRSNSSSTPRSHTAAPRGSGANDTGSCTAAAPCTGPRGGTYYITPGGTKRYLPR